MTFGRGTVWNARFAPDGQTIVYSAAWNGKPLEIFSTRPDSPESRSVGLTNADVLAISSAGEMAVLLNRHYLGQLISRGTLARMPLIGGAPREIVDDVQEADWSPDGKNLAVVRYVDGRDRLEYPVGKVLYETAGWISFPRISPKGDQIAFLDYPTQWGSDGGVALMDLAGHRKMLWVGRNQAEDGLAWSPAGDEVWFSMVKAGETEAVYAVTLEGRERVVARAPVDLLLRDISREGRVLATPTSYQSAVIALPPGEKKERDLSWLPNEWVGDLSADGKIFAFLDQDEGSGTDGITYLGKTDGSPPVRLGDGMPLAISPDGKWVLAHLFTLQQLILLPTGTGEVKRLDRNGIERYGPHGVHWLPDGKRIVFTAREPNRGTACYIQDIERGNLRAITPEGIVASGSKSIQNGNGISPDGKFLIGEDSHRNRSLYPIEGGEPRPFAGLDDKDEIVRWADEHSLFVYRPGELPMKVYRLDLQTGRKELWKEVTPADLAGLVRPPFIYLTPDGKSYIYEIYRTLSDLYLAEGLK